MILWTVLDMSSGGVPAGTDLDRTEQEARALSHGHVGANFKVCAVVPADGGYLVVEA